MTNPRIWALNITTFRGTAAFGAQHSYGLLMAPETHVPIEGRDDAVYYVKGQIWSINRIMTAEQAARLNEVNGLFGRDYAMDNKAGDASHQFDTDEEVERYGIAVWREVCDDPTAVLLKTSFGYSGPCKPLAGPPEVMEALTPIYELDESETSYDWTDVREDALKQWDQAFARLGLESESGAGKKTIFDSNAPKAPRDLMAYVATDGDSLSVTFEKVYE